MSLFTVLATSKVAAGVLAAGAVAAGGTGVAAFNGALPTGIQQAAHDLVGAPAPVDGTAAEAADAARTATAKATDAVGTAQAKAAEAAEAGQSTAAEAASGAKATVEDATSPEAFGLCTAFLNGDLKSDSKVPGFESLTIAAGGEAKVEAHCEAVVDAGKAADAKVNGSAKAGADVDASVTSDLPATPAVP
ncbi:hypothetical protein HP499_22070, partial [Paenarthrobacter sp. CM16]|uniref:hypothetical protein n=1 Tax=Paenarthrobacter sp. CM16 TaxID=2738447 RepID=UPI001552D51B